MIRASRHPNGISNFLRFWASLRKSVLPSVQDPACASLLPDSSYACFRQFSYLNKTSPSILSSGGMLRDSSQLYYVRKPPSFFSSTQASHESGPNQDPNADSKNPSNDSSADGQAKPDPQGINETNGQEQKPLEDGEEAAKEEEEKDLLGLLALKEGELENKEKEIKKLHDSLLRSYAEMENLRDRTKREIESARKFAVQEFAKSLLDVADNLSRASSVTKGSMKKAEISESTASNSNDSESHANEAEKLLQSLLDGVDMTQKQLMQVFKKHGLVQFDPIDQVFDPNFHNALFEVADPTKTPGTIAVVTKTGYSLNDRVIRPAEVGVVKDPNQ